MLSVVRQCGEAAIAVGTGSSVFTWWLSLYEAQQQQADREGRGRLLTGFGVSLFERAVIDAFCRRHEISFADALRHNEFGIELGAIHPGLGAAALASCVRREPLRQVTVRHTIGLADHLTEGDIPDADRVRDGLPESLEASIRHYGLTHFKAKLSGDADGDLERLRRIVHVLGRLVGDYRLTLDGNEQYSEMSRLRDFWETLGDDPALRPPGTTCCSWSSRLPAMTR